MSLRGTSQTIAGDSLIGFNRGKDDRRPNFFLRSGASMGILCSVALTSVIFMTYLVSLGVRQSYNGSIRQVKS